MKLYITSGTYPFMLLLKKKQKKHSLILLQNESDTLLLHETEGKTVFQTPRSYEVLTGFGDIEQKGYCVMHHIPVDAEDIDVFEFKLKNYPLKKEYFHGLSAFRTLRPIKGNTYIVLSVWDSSNAFTLSEKQYTYPDTLIQEFKNQWISIHSPTYVTKYVIPKEEDLE